MKVTADTITDIQLREMRDEALDNGAYATAQLCTYAMFGWIGEQRRDARARCAEIWNART